MFKVLDLKISQNIYSDLKLSKDLLNESFIISENGKFARGLRTCTKFDARTGKYVRESNLVSFSASFMLNVCSVHDIPICDPTVTLVRVVTVKIEQPHWTTEPMTMFEATPNTHSLGIGMATLL